MRKKKFFKKILIILGILFIVLILLLFINLKAWKYFEKKEVKMIPLVDSCSVLFDNIIHNIKDAPGCENYCRAECMTREMEFYKSEFSLKEKACNTCDCYCR